MECYYVQVLSIAWDWSNVSKNYSNLILLETTFQKQIAATTTITTTKIITKKTKSFKSERSLSTKLDNHQ